jgi:predicted signal transduction protein with EAL and GGDEF domain
MMNQPKSRVIATPENSRKTMPDTRTSGPSHGWSARRRTRVVMPLAAARAPARLTEVTALDVKGRGGDTVPDRPIDGAVEHLGPVGGDEFAMVLVGPEGTRRARELAPSIIAAMEEPVPTGRVKAFIGASIGVASFPGDGESAADIRQAADLALYRAKQGGRGTACFYNQAMDAAVHEHRLLEQALRDALDRNEIGLAFQPVFAVGTRTISSFEALARWTQLRGLGIQILMDDFGVGYSSLSYFQRFPFDKVKIDRSFVEAVSTSPAAQAIVGAVVQLGSALRMGVVAEGVETAEQLQSLAKAGCTHVQGYLLGRPVPVEEVHRLLGQPDQDT